MGVCNFEPFQCLQLTNIMFHVGVVVNESPSSIALNNSAHNTQIPSLQNKKYCNIRMHFRTEMQHEKIVESKINSKHNMSFPIEIVQSLTLSNWTRKYCAWSNLPYSHLSIVAHQNVLYSTVMFYKSKQFNGVPGYIRALLCNNDWGEPANQLLTCPPKICRRVSNVSNVKRLSIMVITMYKQMRLPSTIEVNTQLNWGWLYQ